MRSDRATKNDKTLSDLQVDMGPGIIVSQEKVCLLWLGSGSLSLQLSQYHDVGLIWWFVQILGNPKGSPLSYPKGLLTSLYPLKAAS